MLRSTLLLTLGLGSACAAARPPGAGALAPAAGERHLRNIRQLTFGGDNPEASFSRSGRRLIVQRQERVDSGCDQRYVINVDGTGLRRITRRPGYDGGAVFSPDGRALAWRARYPETAADPAEYLDLPARRQLRSRLHSRRKAHHLCFQFPAAPQPELRPVRRDPEGGDLEQITFDPEFDGFRCSVPMAAGWSGPPTATRQ